MIGSCRRCGHWPTEGTDAGHIEQNSGPGRPLVEPPGPCPEHVELTEEDIDPYAW